MSAGNPIFQIRMKPDVRENLIKAQDRIEAYSGEKMGLATIVRHALDEYLEYVLSSDTDVEELKSIPIQRRAIDSLSITDEITKRKLVQEFDFPEAK